MKRRQFMQLGMVGLTGGAVVSRLGMAQSSGATDNNDVLDTVMAGGLYYTREAPGRWEKKVETHLAKGKVQRQGEQLLVRLKTEHEMKGYEHYIVKHVLLDSNFRFLTEKMFHPEHDREAVSEFLVPVQPGPFYALSICNKHDIWISRLALLPLAS